jgi:hypothetical protein
MRVPLTISSHPSAAGQPRAAEPLSFGVPFPKGRIRDTSAWCVIGGLGAAPACARVLDRWPDGSIRWASVDTQLSFDGRSSDAWWLDVQPEAEPAGLPALRVRTSPEGTCTVETASLRFVVASGSERILDVLRAASDAPDPCASVAMTVQASGAAAARAVTFDRVAIEHQNALRVVVLADGSVECGSGRRLAVMVRLEFFAGHPTVRVLVTVRNPHRAMHPGNFWDLGDPGSVLLRDVALIVSRTSPADSAAASVSLESDAAPIERELPLEIYQDSSGGENWRSSNHINRDRQVPTSFRGYRMRSAHHEEHGLRATPVVRLAGSSSSLGAAYPAFWENFPKAIDATDAGLTIGLLPRQFNDLHELQGGEQKTHECFLTFGDDRVSVPALHWCRTRTLVSVDPAWAMQSEAIAFLAPLEREHQALVTSAVEGPHSFEAKREVIDEFGWRHFGEIYGDHEAIRQTGPPLVSHYNNQYDPLAGFALQFLRTGDRRWWVAMDELARHVIDIDIYHTADDKAAYNGGLFWHTYHYGDADTSTHRTYPLRGKGKTFGGGPSADHNYPTGLMWHFFLTGEEMSRQAAIGLAEYVVRLDDGRLSPWRWLTTSDTGGPIVTAPAFYGPARSSGNSLNALVDGHRLTGDERFLAKADQLVQRIMHPHDDIVGRHQLDQPETRWFYTMALQALGKYLHYCAELGRTGDAYAYARASLLHYARWMAEHEYPYLDKPEKLEHPTETWAAQDIRKSDIFCYAAIHADGDERPRFLERAAFFHRHSTETLTRMPTHVLARPVIVMLTSGALLNWLSLSPRSAEAEPRPVDVAWGPPVKFVPQRVIAKRRAKQIAVGLGLIGLAGLVALVQWLWAPIGR